MIKHQDTDKSTTQNHRMVWVVKDLNDHLVPTLPATGRDTFY